VNNRTLRSFLGRQGSRFAFNVFASRIIGKVGCGVTVVGYAPTAQRVVSYRLDENRRLIY